MRIPTRVARTTKPAQQTPPQEAKSGDGTLQFMSLDTKTDTTNYQIATYDEIAGENDPDFIAIQGLPETVTSFAEDTQEEVPSVDFGQSEPENCQTGSGSCGSCLPSFERLTEYAQDESELRKELKEVYPDRCMSVCECMERASRYSTLGNLICLEARTLDCDKHPHLLGLIRQKKIKAIETKLLASAEKSARDASVAQALKSYYMLGGAQARLALLTQMLSQIDVAIAQTEKQKNLGLAIPKSPDELKRQRSLLFTAGAQARSALRKSNAELVEYTGLCVTPCLPLLGPQINWHVQVTPIDICSEVQLGLSNNRELVWITTLSRMLDSAAMAAIEAFLPTIQPLLAYEQAFTHSRLGAMLAFICPGKKGKCLLDIRRRQLRLYASRRREEVTREILEAVYDLEGAGEQLAFEQAIWKNLKRNLDDMTEKQQSGLAPDTAVTLSQIELLRQSDVLVEKTIQWHLFLVQLAYVQSNLDSLCEPALEKLVPVCAP